MKRWDVVAQLRYVKKDGSEGKQYLRCGTAFDGEKGVRLQLDALPLRDWDGWLSFYEPKEKTGSDAPKTARPAGTEPDEDIPF